VFENAASKARQHESSYNLAHDTTDNRIREGGFEQADFDNRRGSVKSNITKSPVPSHDAKSPGQPNYRTATVVPV